ncbi:MAG: tRNA (adenine-N1)-methyltransferase [Ignisphaera sp.]|uniref:tRNA (Adenine-N1)-methyltransferase n=1 Tax=Ignisphaera aggregans TaxID=334771 RepID=A0A7J3MYV4_9CREN
MTSGLSDNLYVNPDDRVLIYIDRRRRWITKIEKDKVFTSDRGFIYLGDIIGLGYGSRIKTSTKFDVYLLKPLLIDFLEKGLTRVTQVIYPKDQGFIVMLLGLSPGSRVVEVGVGTGNTTAVLANIVRPTGHIYGYEIRKEFLNIARKNLEILGLASYVTLKLKDAKEGIDERDVDGAVIDVADPWDLLEPLHITLKPSAPVVFFIPSFNQIEKLYNSLVEHGGYIDIRCYEVLLREIMLTREAIRPSSLMIGHTGYIMFARKVTKV